jgi:hypothetical protein
MSTLTTHTQATRATPSSSNIGLCKFNTTSKAIEVSDGTNWLVYDYDSQTYGYSGSNTASMSFDGIDDYLQSSSNISFASDFSLSFWIKPTNNNDCWFGLLNSATAFISSNTSGNIQVNGTVSTVGITTGEWNHILLSRSSSTITIYKKSDTGNASGSITKSGTLSYNVLGRYTSGGYYHLGLMDEVAVFNTALSSTDATNIYNSGAPGDLYSYSSLTNWWRMGEEISGGTIPDVSNVNSNDLTVNGAVTSTDVPS